jgi:KDO2-lipid IV(A) lauroyltransferase
MALSDLHRSGAFAALARFAPALTVRMAIAAARRDSARDDAASRRQLQANFGRAFPGLDHEELAILCTRHRAAKYHAGVLLAHLRRLDRAGLHRHARRHVRYRDPAVVDRIARHDGPVVMLTPHYGAYLSASLRLMADIGPSKRLNLFFDDPANNTTTGDYEPIYRRYDGNAAVLFNNRRSVVTALKALQQGQVLTMMPDVYEIGGNHVAVPFLGGLTHAMTGTAFFALKSQALLVPVYCHPVDGLDCELDVQAAIPLSAAGDFSQALFETTARIFANMEAQLLRRPDHWIYWSELHRRFPCATRLPAQPDGDWSGQLVALLAEIQAQSPALAPVLEEVGRRASALSGGITTVAS